MKVADQKLIAEEERLRRGYEQMRKKTKTRTLMDFRYFRTDNTTGSATDEYGNREEKTKPRTDA